MKNKIDRLSKMIVGRGTPARIVTEILNDGWEKTGWSGKSCTSAKERRGLKGFARSVRRMGLDSGSALYRIFTGASVQVLPLP